jgi:hypothetical protein
MVEWSLERLNEWDIQLQLNDGFTPISSTPTTVCLAPSDCYVCHEPMYPEHVTTCRTCPRFTIHSHCRLAHGPDIWKNDLCDRG